MLPVPQFAGVQKVGIAANGKLMLLVGQVQGELPPLLGRLVLLVQLTQGKAVQGVGVGR